MTSDQAQSPPGTVPVTEEPAGTPVVTQEWAGSSAFAGLATEAGTPGLSELDLLCAEDLVALLCAQVRRVPPSVTAAAPAIAAAVSAVVECLERGGRLVYLGAGTAGRIGALEEAEARPTFNVAEGTVIGIVARDAVPNPPAGRPGPGAGPLTTAGTAGATAPTGTAGTAGATAPTGTAGTAGATAPTGATGPAGRTLPAWNGQDEEDDEAAGAAALCAIEITESDVAVGISASGHRPYVLGAMREAGARGALRVGIACNPEGPLAKSVELAIEIPVGHEIIPGSTRMNAGTAQNVVLDVLSTAVMVRLSKTYGNLMVGPRPTNEKLRDRATPIVHTITGATTAQSRAALEASDWEPKVAAAMLAGGIDPEEASARLDEHRGRLREALESMQGDQPASFQRASSRAGTWSRLGVRAAVVEGELVPGDVGIASGKVVAVGLSSRPGASAIALPGLVDAQVNGYAGVDLLGAESDAIVKMGEALLADGVFAYQPTLITSETGDLLAALSRIAPLVGLAGRHACVLGVHLEGPFLSHARSGAHPVHHLRDPDLSLLERLLDAAPVTEVTLAPELPGALELVRACARRRILVSLGHSAASPATAGEAFCAGASAVTHLFNAMAPLSARSPGLAGAALTTPGVTLQLIGDGVHVSSEMLRLAFAAAPGRCTLVTDALAAAGLGDGPILLGEVLVEVREGVARRDDGTIAGGTARLVDGLANLVGIGIPLVEAVEAVTRRPAALLGNADFGRLYPGGPADLVVLGEDLTIARVLKEGIEVSRR